MRLKNSVAFKGNNGNIDIVFTDLAEKDELLVQLEAKLDAMKSFVKNAHCKIRVSGMDFSAYQQSVILGLLLKYLGENITVTFENDKLLSVLSEKTNK